MPALQEGKNEDPILHGLLTPSETRLSREVPHELRNRNSTGNRLLGNGVGQGIGLGMLAVRIIRPCVSDHRNRGLVPLEAQQLVAVPACRGSIRMTCAAPCYANGLARHRA